MSAAEERDRLKAALADARSEAETAEHDLSTAEQAIRRAIADGAADQVVGNRQASRDEFQRRLERATLRIETLEAKLGQAEQAAKVERIASLEREAGALAADFDQAEDRGYVLALKLAEIVRELQELRERGLAVDRTLQPYNAVAVGPEPVELLRALAGCTNAVRTMCFFGKPSLEAERQIPLPDAGPKGSWTERAA